MKYARDRGDFYLHKPGNAQNPLIDGNLRNIPCPCGSGKKVKKCCGDKRSITKESSNLIKNLVLEGKRILEQELAAQSSTEGELNGDAHERSSIS